MFFLETMALHKENSSETVDAEKTDSSSTTNSEEKPSVTDSTDKLATSGSDGQSNKSSKERTTVNTKDEPSSQVAQESKHEVSKVTE